MSSLSLLVYSIAIHLFNFDIRKQSVIKSDTKHRVYNSDYSEYRNIDGC